MAPPVVPYDGLPKGNVAIAVGRALSRAGYMQWGDFTPSWGTFKQRACANFEHDNKLKVTGNYPKATHDALVKTHRKNYPHEWAFGALEVKMMRDEAISPREKVEQEIINGVQWSIDHQWLIQYVMARPFPCYAKYPVNHSWWNDCSGMFAQWYRWGGAPDPHRNHYDGFGNTSTLWSYGETVNGLRNAELCDAILYGTPWKAGGSAHVVLLRAYRGGVWYAGSHGRDSGPNEVSANYRTIVGIRRFPLTGGIT